MKPQKPRPKLPRDYAGVIDELGRVGAKLIDLKSWLAREGELKAQIRSWFAAYPPEQGGVVEGKHFAASVSAMRNVREIISIKAVAQAMGQEFFKHCTMPLGDLDKHLDKAQRARLIKEERTGQRAVAVEPRIKPRKAA